VESGQVDGGGLLVAGGDAAPLLEAVDAPLDCVALPVRLAVEGWWSAAPATATQPVGYASPVAVLLRQVDSLRSGLELEGDRVDHLSVIPPPATPLRRPVRE
jgi:hypothetical protein